MHGILQRCHSTLLYCQQEQGSCTQDVQAFTPAFTEALAKVMPGVRSLYECWNKALGKKDKEMKEKKKKAEEESDSASDSEEITTPGLYLTLRMPRADISAQSLHAQMADISAQLGKNLVCFKTSQNP